MTFVFQFPASEDAVRPGVIDLPYPATISASMPTTFLETFGSATCSATLQIYDARDNLVTQSQSQRTLLSGPSDTPTYESVNPTLVVTLPRGRYRFAPDVVTDAQSWNATVNVLVNRITWACA